MNFEDISEETRKIMTELFLEDISEKDKLEILQDSAESWIDYQCAVSKLSDGKNDIKDGVIKNLYQSNKKLKKNLSAVVPELERARERIKQLEAEKAEQAAEIASLKAELAERNDSPPAVATTKKATGFIKNVIAAEYPDGKYKGLKKDAIAADLIAEADKAGFAQEDIPSFETIKRHYL